MTTTSFESEIDAYVAGVSSYGVALSGAEIRRIAHTLGRLPSETELYAFDAQWSEHCSYKSSRHHLRRLPTDGPTVMQGPAEDAGILHLGEWEGERYGIVIAHESHNHPSQVVPFEGAATGIGGIVRDVLCMGAQVIAVANPLRFGRLDDAHCRYVAQGVVDGIAAYGNAIGVPNIGGDVYIDESFDDNVLVNVVALGLVKESEIIHSKAPKGSVGWDIVLVGKATDRSGFGGASFSSVTLDEDDAEANKGAVQVPDPFLKNVIMRASYRVFEALRAQGIEAGFKDLGAGGMAGCTLELVASGGYGASIDLDKAPTGQPNLPPAVIAIGETQERLAWVVPPSFTPELLRIYNEEYSLPEISRGACAAVIGVVTEEPFYVARFHGEEVMRVPTRFLTDGVRYNRPYTVALPDVEPFATFDERTRDQRVADLDRATVEKILAHRDVCSRAPIYTRFDSVVRGTTAIPAGEADAGVIVPIPGAPLAVALSVDGNPRYGAIDAMRAAELAVCESARNVAAVGARPVGMTDCLNFGDPTDPKHLGEFVAAVDGLAFAARRLGTPFVSGNVSLYNQSKAGRAISPSPIVACVGTIPNIAKSATFAIKRSGSAVHFVGMPQPNFGGSVYADICGFRSPNLPTIDYDEVAREIDLMIEAFDQGVVLAAHDISDGGGITALCEMAFASLDRNRAGFRIDTSAFPDKHAHDEAIFYGEAGGFIVEVTDSMAFARLAERHRVFAPRIAYTTGDATLRYKDLVFDLFELRETWAAPLRDFYADASA